MPENYEGGQFTKWASPVPDQKFIPGGMKINALENVTADRIDPHIKGVEKCFQTWDAAGNIKKRTIENNMIIHVEKLRDLLAAAIKGDRSNLKAVFECENCLRVNKIKAFEQIRKDPKYSVWSNKYQTDDRWDQMCEQANVIVLLLRDFGSYREPDLSKNWLFEKVAFQG
jgi:hypothetical protein